MGARRSLRVLILLSCVAWPGCSTKALDTASAAFLVVGTSPDSGAEGATEATQPELQVNAAAEPAVCTADSLDFVGLGAGDAVAFWVDYSVSIESEGSLIRLLPDSALPTGYRYAVMVKTGGAAPCADIDGRPLQAFGFEFTVP